MKVSVLYSGGKDSSLAAYILRLTGHEVELVTVNFGLLESYRPAQMTARRLGFRHRVLKLETEILDRGCARIVEDSHPGNGINYIHREALKEVAKVSIAVGDGTRRDDRIPKLSIQEIRSLEDRYDVEYLAPLHGLGYKTINRLTDEILEYRKDLSEKIEKSDYEVEIREFIKRNGYSIDKIFPMEHIQSRVIGFKGDLNG